MSAFPGVVDEIAHKSRRYFTVYIIYDWRSNSVGRKRRRKAGGSILVAVAFNP